VYRAALREGWYKRFRHEKHDRHIFECFFGRGCKLAQRSRKGRRRAAGQRGGVMHMPVRLVTHPAVNAKESDDGEGRHLNEKDATRRGANAHRFYKTSDAHDDSIGVR
jgi:hypothetical protein